MAEFSEVMRQWSRLCGRHNDMMYCEGCPLDASKTCGIVSDLRMEDIKDAEKTIMAWAAEHPEPVYPTWWKYMCMIGVIPNTLGDKTLGEVAVDRLMNTEIPADIAEKLGIKPIGGVNDENA